MCQPYKINQTRNKYCVVLKLLFLELMEYCTTKCASSRSPPSIILMWSVDRICLISIHRALFWYGRKINLSSCCLGNGSSFSPSSHPLYSLQEGTGSHLALTRLRNLNIIYTVLLILVRVHFWFWICLQFPIQSWDATWGLPDSQLLVNEQMAALVRRAFTYFSSIPTTHFSALGVLPHSSIHIGHLNCSWSSV